MLVGGAGKGPLARAKCTLPGCLPCCFEWGPLPVAFSQRAILAFLCLLSKGSRVMWNSMIVIGLMNYGIASHLVPSYKVGATKTILSRIHLLFCSSTKLNCTLLLFDVTEFNPLSSRMQNRIVLK